MKPRGIYLSSESGTAVPDPILALVTPLFGGKKVMFSDPEDRPGDGGYFKELTECGEFKPIINRTYPLDHFVDAYR